MNRGAVHVDFVRDIARFDNLVGGVLKDSIIADLCHLLGQIDATERVPAFTYTGEDDVGPLGYFGHGLCGDRPELLQRFTPRQRPVRVNERRCSGRRQKLLKVLGHTDAHGAETDPADLLSCHGEE